jgi:hypothetical protein
MTAGHNFFDHQCLHFKSDESPDVFSNGFTYQAGFRISAELYLFYHESAAFHIPNHCSCRMMTNRLREKETLDAVTGHLFQLVQLFQILDPFCNNVDVQRPGKSNNHSHDFHIFFFPLLATDERPINF